MRPPAERVVRQHLRRMRLALTAADDPAVGAEMESAKHHLASTLASALTNTPANTPTTTVADALPGSGSAAEIILAETKLAAVTLAEEIRAETTLAETTLAALSLGDFDAAPRVARLLGEHQESQEELTPLYLLLLARHLAWTGSVHFLRAEWPRVLRALDRRPGMAHHGTAQPGTAQPGISYPGVSYPGMPHPGTGYSGTAAPSASAAWYIALQELALAAESIGEKALAESLRAELETSPAEQAEHTMPTERSGQTPAAERLEQAFAAAHHAQALAAGQPEQVFAAGRPVQALAAGQPEQALYSVLAGPLSTANPAKVVEYYLRSVLGVEPDAPQNRLVLRPRLPEEWTEVQVEHLSFGDAEITLRYQREGDWHRFTFLQESGPVPVRVIFEPLIPAPGLASARVDGQEALLEPRPRQGRLLVPVQIVLDDMRLIEIEGSQRRERARISLPVR